MEINLKITPLVTNVQGINAKPFPYSLKGLTISQPEPNCPFCQKPLSNAHCSCSQFLTAEKKLLTEIAPNDDLLILTTDSCQEISVDGRKLMIEEQPADKICLDVFLGGQPFEMRQMWECSRGGYWTDTELLSFYLRPIGGEKVYHCLIFDFKYQSSLPEIKIVQRKQVTKPGQSRKIGDYSITRDNECLKTFHYPDFLRIIGEYAG